MLASEQDESFVGVDVGGTSIKIGWIRSDGQQRDETSVPTPPESADEAIKRISAVVGQWRQRPGRQGIRAIGLGTPGPLDLPEGRILTPVNLRAWGDFPIRDRLSRAVSLPVVFANDANAAAFGEYWLGGGQQQSSLVLFTLGTGVGSGIVIDDRLLIGSTGNGGEFGHLTVDYRPDTRLCSCGQPGHLEAWASATAVGQIATTRMRQSPAGTAADGLLANRLASQGRLTALDIHQAALQDDPLALQLIDETADWLVRGIGHVVYSVDPRQVLLGGAMNFGGPQCRIGQRFLGRVRAGTRGIVFSAIARNLRIEFARLGGSAGWIGAAGLARRDYHAGKLNPAEH